MSNLASFVGFPQVAPSDGGGFWGPAGQASGRPVFQSVGTDLIDFTGTTERSYSRVKTQVSATQQYQTTKFNDSVASHDLVMNVTHSSVVRDCGKIPFAGQLRSIGDVNMILAGESMEPGSRGMSARMNTAEDVMRQFRIAGVARHWAVQTTIGKPSNLDQGMLLLGTRGHETIYNYWELDYFKDLMDHPEMGPSVRKYLLSPSEITTQACLWFALIKVPHSSTVSLVNGVNQTRDEVRANMTSAQASKWHWAFVPVATRSVEFPDFLLLGKDGEGKKWFGQKIYIGRVMYRRHGNITAPHHAIPGSFANAVFQLLFPTRNVKGMGVDPHVEASIDYYGSRMVRNSIPFASGIPMIDIIFRDSYLPGLMCV